MFPRGPSSKKYQFFQKCFPEDYFRSFLPKCISPKTCSPKGPFQTLLQKCYFLENVSPEVLFGRFPPKCHFPKDIPRRAWEGATPGCCVLAAPKWYLVIAWTIWLHLEIRDRDSAWFFGPHLYFLVLALGLKSDPNMAVRFWPQNVCAWLVHLGPWAPKWARAQKSYQISAPDPKKCPGP